MKPRQLVRMHTLAVGGMTDSTRIAFGYRLRVAALIVVAMLVLAACGGGSSGGHGVASVSSSRGLAASSPSAGGSSSAQSAVAYSGCMRLHGVPNYPDPGSDGSLPKGDAQHFGVSTSQYQAALRACQPLLPNSDAFNASLVQCLMNGDGDCPHALVQRALTEGRTFAQCMRHQGVPNWPDPTVDPEGRPSFQTTAAGISIADTRSPQMLSKIGHCEGQRGAAALLRME